jgi:hypothetical protein
MRYTWVVVGAVYAAAVGVFLLTRDLVASPPPTGWACRGVAIVAGYQIITCRSPKGACYLTSSQGGFVVAQPEDCR